MNFAFGDVSTACKFSAVAEIYLMEIDTLFEFLKFWRYCGSSLLIAFKNKFFADSVWVMMFVVCEN